MEQINLILAIASFLATVIIACITFRINKKIEEENEFKHYLELVNFSKLGMFFSISHTEEAEEAAKENFLNHLDDLCEYALKLKNKKLLKTINDAYGDVIDKFAVIYKERINFRDFHQKIYLNDFKK